MKTTLVRLAGRAWPITDLQVAELAIGRESGISANYARKGCGRPRWVVLCLYNERPRISGLAGPLCEEKNIMRATVVLSGGGLLVKMRGQRASWGPVLGFEL